MKKGDFRKILAAFFSVASFSYLVAITFVAVPKDNADNTKIILGFLLGTAIATILGYYFGDSDKGSGE